MIIDSIQLGDMFIFEHSLLKCVILVTIQFFGVLLTLQSRQYDFVIKFHYLFVDCDVIFNNECILSVFSKTC